MFCIWTVISRNLISLHFEATFPSQQQVDGGCHRSWSYVIIVTYRSDGCRKRREREGEQSDGLDFNCCQQLLCMAVYELLQPTFVRRAAAPTAVSRNPKYDMGDIPRTNDARAIIEIECRITTNAVSLTVNMSEYVLDIQELEKFPLFPISLHVCILDRLVCLQLLSLANRKGGSELSIRSDGFSSIESNLAADSPTCHNLAQPRLSLSLFAPSFPLRLINNEKEKKSARGGFAAINTRPLASQPVSSFFDFSIYNSDDYFGTMQKSQITTF